MQEAQTKAYFVSDIHLGSREDPKFFAFKSFLEKLIQEKPTHLFMLGDIFDLWVGNYTYFKKQYAELIDLLKQLQSLGCGIHYFEGNHDLYLKKFWQDQLGFIVHPQAIYMDLAGQRLRLEHGDQMDPADKGYLFLRAFLRNPVIKFVVNHLPEKVMLKIGHSSSETSRNYTSEVKTVTEEQSGEKFVAHGKRAYEKEVFDLLISGHIHFQFDFKINEKARIVNLGTWLDKPCAFVVSENEQKFVTLQP